MSTLSQQLITPQAMLAYQDKIRKSKDLHNTQAHIIEEQVLKLSGLELHKELHVFDVPIDSEGKDYIHTYMCGGENEETLLLIHGYGGSSILYFPMLKELSQKYRVFCIDLLGMGLSSRNKFECTTTEDTIDYFVESIEKWREAMNIESFFLAGHSFGGYMSTHYSIKYKNRVRKLLLLSPVGVTKHEKIPTPEEFVKDMSWFKKKFFSFALSFWETKTTPFAYFRSHTTIGKCLLKFYLNRQFNTDGKNDELVKLLFNYFIELIKLEGGSEVSVFYILQPPRAIAKIPLQELILNDLDMPISCYYGDKDWMDKTGAYHIESKRSDFKIKHINNSGHQITMHNPSMLSEGILLDIMC